VAEDSEQIGRRWGWWSDDVPCEGVEVGVVDIGVEEVVDAMGGSELQ
jgi:hypothetical protein